MDGLVTLEKFVADTVREPFVWGVNDCALWSASAVAACTGVDPAKDLRGTYSSWIECRHILHRAGGLANLTKVRMASLDALQPFDDRDDRGVGVVRLGGQVLCAVILDGRALMRMARGVRVADNFELIAGWTCHRF